MSTTHAAPVLARAYRWLAQAFPQEFVQVYGDDVTSLSEEMILEAAASTGWLGFLPLVARLFFDLSLRIAAEYWNELKLDVRYSLRTVRKSPGFACLSILSLGLGIGTCTSSYSQFEGTMFRPVPGVGDPAGVITALQPVSYPLYEHFRDHSGQFASVAAYAAPVPFVMQTPAGPQRTWGHLVTNNYFEVLRAGAFAGRPLSADDRPGSIATAVISHRIWQNRYGGRRDLIGSTQQINGSPVLVVGIMPEAFLGASPVMQLADLWLPVSVGELVAPELANGALEDRKHAVFSVIGRLKPGITTAQAEAALDAQVRQLEQRYNDPAKDRKNKRITLAPGGRVLPIRDEDLPVLMVFPLVLIGLMMWIVCANIATLLLAKSISRRREIAVRLAVGASRWRMVRQLLTESTILALAGGAVGLPFAIWSNSSIDKFQDIIPAYSSFDVSVSIPALMFTFILSAGTGILFGLAPALQATKTDLSTAMKAGANDRLKGYRWFSSRNFLILQQVAGSVTLLLLTGFIVIGFERKSTLDLGYNAKDLWTFSIDPIRDGYTPERAVQFLSGLRRKVEAVPGVMSATISQSSPLSMFSRESAPVGNSDLATAREQLFRVIRTETVGAGFFETLSIPLLRGRALLESDFKPGAPWVAVVNETLVERVFNKQDPLGKTLDIKDRKYEVIGVAKNVRSGWVVDIEKSGAYVPNDPEGFRRPLEEGVQLLVRTRPGVDAGKQVRELFSSLDPNLSLYNVSTVTEKHKNMLLIGKMASAIYAGIGLYGLVLAAIGLAGVTAYSVLQRTKEIGIRVALGAKRRDVLRLVLREGVTLTLIGSAFGILCAFGVHRVAGAFLSMLSDVTDSSASDPVLVIGAPLLLMVFALLACYGPARRALRIHPLAALRDE